jgi:hypothetical protein
LPLVYHGSNVLFDQPDLAKARAGRDFGQGFYTTTIRSQAEEWATTAAARLGGLPYVYEFDLSLTAELRVLEFPGMSVEWLEMVKTNRVARGLHHDYDVVMGPVANDNTMRTIALYVAGTYDAEEAMRRLRYFKANNQVSLHTPRAMAMLEP